MRNPTIMVTKWVEFGWAIIIIVQKTRNYTSNSILSKNSYVVYAPSLVEGMSHTLCTIKTQHTCPSAFVSCDEKH